MSWKDTIASALRPQPRGDEMNEFERVTREVAEVLNEAEPAMRAEVRARYVGNLLRLDLLTRPTRRPVERSIMISMSADASGGLWVPTPAGLGPLKDHDPETLRTYLVTFFTSPTFVATVGHYRQRNEEPIDAWLKKVDYRKVDLSDAAFLVQGEEQDKLVRAYDASNFSDPIDVVAEPLEPVGNFRPYSPATTYAMFDAGGFVLRVVRHAAAPGGKVHVTGVPRGDLDWLADG